MDFLQRAASGSMEGSMSVESLQQELAALPAHERRRVQAFLVALQDSSDDAYRKKLSEKIDKPVENFATLEELDRRLDLGRPR